METEEKYIRAFHRLDGIINRRCREQSFAALGCSSNLDLLCEFRVERLNQLLEAHMPGAELTELKAPGHIKTMDDLISTIVYYCSHGIGGEADVGDTKLVSGSFPFVQGMGGTGVQAAMALAAVGCPSVVHLTDDSKEVCDMLKSPYIYTVSPQGMLVHTDEISQTQEQEIHFIIQFKKGDEIRLNSQSVRIPASNRLIITKFTVNEKMPFSEAYFKWLETNAGQIGSIVLSSFNALLDRDVLLERLRYAERHIWEYRRMNPGGIVFFEDAHYHDYEIRKLCLESAYHFVDIVSLNEEELEYTLRMYKHEVDTGDIISCIRGGLFIRERFGVRRGVIVHTKDYSMYVGETLEADIESGLMFGNMMATAKAASGWYGTRKDLEKVLEFALSPKGRENQRIVTESEFAGDVIIVPAKYIDRPQYTIGLGDSFVGGVQLCF